MKLIQVTLVALLFSLSTSVAVAENNRSFTDDLGRTVQIPVNPQRIASLDDLRLTIPLIELNVLPVASHGRDEGKGPYIRSSAQLTGVDFDNSDIIFLGNAPLDIEVLAMAQPDLIVTLVSRDSPIEQLELIAPTVVFDESSTDRFQIYQRLAELVNQQERLEKLEARYQGQLAQLNRLIDTESISVAVMEGNHGQISVQHTYGSLGKVLRDAGFQFPELINNLAPGKEEKLSAEYLPQLNADVIFDTYRSDRNETPADADEKMRTVMADYCDYLWACAHDQYIRLPRDEPYAISYQSLSAMTTVVLTLMSAQGIETQSE